MDHSRRRHLRHQPPGHLVDVGGFRLHVQCRGEGQPTVVFEAALGGSSLSWGFVQSQVAAWTRTCSYDRAGLGWSDAGPLPRTAGRCADELQHLLARADLPPPYVLVAHSFGTLVARLFAARNPATVAGLVLVEPAFPEDLIEADAGERRRMRRGVRMCRYGAVAARLRIAHLAAAVTGGDAFGLARAAATFVSRRRVGREHSGLLSPIQKLPPAERAALRWMWTQPGFFEALGSQIQSIDATAREVLDAGTSFGDMPLVVISATQPKPHHAAMQERLTRASARGRRIVAAASGHWVPLDEPDTIAAAVRDVVTIVRSERPRRSGTD